MLELKIDKNIRSAQDFNTLLGLNGEKIVSLGRLLDSVRVNVENVTNELDRAKETIMLQLSSDVQKINTRNDNM